MKRSILLVGALLLVFAATVSLRVATADNPVPSGGTTPTLKIKVGGAATQSTVNLNAGFSAVSSGGVTTVTAAGTGVPTTRTLTTTSPLTCAGGGSCDLSADRTIAIGPIAESGVASLTGDLAARALTATTMTASTCLTGGGDLSSNRSFAVTAACIGPTQLANTAVTIGTYPSDGAHVPVIAVDQQGRLTSATGTTAIAIAESAVTSLTTDLAAKAPLAAPHLTVNGNTAFVTDSNGAPPAGTCELELDTNYANGSVGYGCSFGVAGRNCAVAQWLPLSTNVAQGQLVCATGGLGVGTCAKTLSLTTVIGVALATGSNGGVVPICIRGVAGVLTADANCTFGATASSDGTTTAGNIQCTVAPVLGSGIGKVLVSAGGGVAQIMIATF